MDPAEQVTRMVEGICPLCGLDIKTTHIPVNLGIFCPVEGITMSTHEAMDEFEPVQADPEAEFEVIQDSILDEAYWSRLLDVLLANTPGTLVKIKRELSTEQANAGRGFLKRHAPQGWSASVRQRQGTWHAAWKRPKGWRA